MRVVKLSKIEISPRRQRKEFSSEALIDLSNSIARNGLLHPVVVRWLHDDTFQLVAGERRLKAIETLWAMGETLRSGTQTFAQNDVPCTDLGDLDPIDAFECELEENLRREDLSWQDRSTATSQLFELRRLQAQKRGETAPEPADLVADLYPERLPRAAQDTVRKELVVARYLKDPEVAAARTLDEGIKVIRRKEENARSVALGESVGRTFSSLDHVLILGDCLAMMERLAEGSFDCILTDPPYGIGAQDFNDSDGKAEPQGHTYDDSYDNWLGLITQLAVFSFRLAKPQAHCYIFCDIDNFVELRGILGRAGWRCFRTPIVWHNPTSQRAPWPFTGPHRRYQLILYAIKGERPIIKSVADVVTYASDINLGWAAQKPCALYQDFLSRTCRAGDSVLDPFCGSGTIFPAAHELKIKATGIELDPIAYGIAVKRIGEL